jgi:thioesterase domain-containing protein
MVPDYIEEIRKIQPSGPYHLLGWSFGGILAFAMANRLQHQGEQVGLLALLDAYPIDKESDRPPQDDQEIMTACLQLLGYDRATLEEEPLQLSSVRELLQREGRLSEDFEDRHLAAIYHGNLQEQRPYWRHLPSPTVPWRSVALSRNTK